MTAEDSRPGLSGRTVCHSLNEGFLPTRRPQNPEWTGRSTSEMDPICSYGQPRYRLPTPRYAFGVREYLPLGETFTTGESWFSLLNNMSSSTLPLA